MKQFEAENKKKLAEFEQFLTNQGYSKQTVNSYSNTMKHLFFFANKSWSELGQMDTEAFKTAFHKGKFCRSGKRELKTSSMSRQISAIRSFYEIFQANQEVVKKIKLRYAKSNVVARVYSKEQIKSLLMGCETELESCAVGIGYYWGLRVSEAITLKRDDINYEKNQAIILGKGNKTVKHDLLPQGFLYVRQFINSGLCSKHIPELLQFTTKSNPAYREFYLHRLEGLLRNICMRKHLPYFGYHALRHSIATHLIESGWDIRQVQVYLRHDNVETTTKYLHEGNKAIKEKGFQL